MAFNFAHLLSAACGGAPRRLGRLRRPWARCARLFLDGCEHRKIAFFLQLHHRRPLQHRCSLLLPEPHRQSVSRVTVRVARLKVGPALHQHPHGARVPAGRRHVERRVASARHRVDGGAATQQRLLQSRLALIAPTSRARRRHHLPKRASRASQWPSPAAK